jgi:hypothetical protein
MVSNFEYLDLDKDKSEPPLNGFNLKYGQKKISVPFSSLHDDVVGVDAKPSRMVSVLASDFHVYMLN